MLAPSFAKRREVLWVSSIRLRTGCEADFLAYGWQRQRISGVTTSRGSNVGLLRNIRDDPCQ